ncbi:hypothetical protein [Streptomyces sp. NPDC050534]|uniref:hypothetical protein n=1 Tax=Streptomyces sp. NPDC050534 TaxID=3365625 RepID=UPI0037BA9D40
MTTAGRARPPEAEDTSLVTACGRRIAVRCLRLAPANRPIGRVTLDVGRDQGDEPGVWASLTTDEARGLARLLLLQAGLVEQDTGAAGPPPQDSPSA